MKQHIPSGNRVSFIWLVKYLYFLPALLVTMLIIIKSIDYFHPDFNRGFLIGKSDIFPVYRYFLYAHMVGSPIAILAGLFQFTFTRSRIHPVIGKIYVVAILALAAPGGLYMAFYAIGGWPSIINFALLATLWWWFTFRAYRLARNQHWKAHRRFMIRSFILTNSAILIRILSYLNHEFQVLDPTLGYVLIAWLSWLPGLLIFELYLSLIEN